MLRLVCSQIDRKIFLTIMILRVKIETDPCVCYAIIVLIFTSVLCEIMNKMKYLEKKSYLLYIKNTKKTKKYIQHLNKNHTHRYILKAILGRIHIHRKAISADWRRPASYVNVALGTINKISLKHYQGRHISVLDEVPCLGDLELVSASAFSLASLLADCAKDSAV